MTEADGRRDGRVTDGFTGARGAAAPPHRGAEEAEGFRVRGLRGAAWAVWAVWGPSCDADGAGGADARVRAWAAARDDAAAARHTMKA